LTGEIGKCKEYPAMNISNIILIFNKGSMKTGSKLLIFKKGGT